MTSNCQENHPLHSEIRFFKIILDTNLQRGNLMIPKKFFAEHGANLSNPVFLRPPDGTEWEIYWTKDDFGGVWFEKGWKEFATYYSLLYGDVVLFKYRKTCNLEVHILDGGNAVEKNYPSNNTQNENGNPDHIINDDSVHVLDEATPTTSCPPPRKKLRTRLSEVVGQSSYLPQENKGGATDIAATSRSKAPSFSVVMKPSHVNGHFMVVPSTFAKTYLKEKQRDDTLLQVLDGRTWPVKYRIGRFSTGWKKFASDNHLKSRDVCVFELTKKRGQCFNVTIIKLSEETPLVQGDGDPRGIPDLKSITTIPIEDIILKSCGFIVMSFTNGAIREAKKFTSENPFFEITLKANHEGDFRPRVPYKFVREYFHEKQIVRLQFGKKSWRVNLVGDVPTKLSKGWTPFSKECKLQPGDICVFELINKVDLVFDVHIFKGHS